MSKKMKPLSAPAAIIYAVMLALAGAASLKAQDDPNMYVMTGSSQDSAADKKYGKDYHKILRDILEVKMFNGVKAAYPCISYLDQSSVTQMVGVERMRELLGGEGESRLPAIADAVNAKHLGYADVKVMGDIVIISGMMGDSTSGKVVGRAQSTVRAGDVAAIATAMEQFVSKLVSSAGGDGPKCPGWQGEITANSSQHKQGKNQAGDAFSTDVQLKISCQIKPGSSEPACTVSYSNKLDGKDSTISTTAGGNARCVAAAGIQKGTGKVRLGPCRVQAVTQVSVVGISSTEKKELSLGGWESEFSVPANARQLSGSKTFENNTTLNWNLTYR